MPAISSKITLSSAAQAANTVIADIDLIKGGTYAVANTSSLESINSNYLTDGQIMFVTDEAVFYKLTITPANPPISFVTTYAWSEVVLGAGSAISSSAQISALGFINADDTGSFLTSADTSSFVLVSQTSSFLTADDTSSFTLVSDFNDITSSLSTFVVYSASNATTASYIDPDFISASAAEAGFGAGGGSEVGGIFIQTGSYFATTNDLQVTGSFTIVDGLFKLTEFETTPNAEAGAIYYSASNFYFGID